MFSFLSSSPSQFISEIRNKVFIFKTNLIKNFKLTLASDLDFVISLVKDIVPPGLLLKIRK